LAGGVMVKYPMMKISKGVPSFDGKSSSATDLQKVVLIPI